jgi:hypothetical protein
LKLTFGEVDNDLKTGQAFIEQHTSISLPWLQVKIMHYFLTLQLGVFELSHGPIPVPVGVRPPVPDPSIVGTDPANQAVFDFIAKTRAEFFGS